MSLLIIHNENDRTSRIFVKKYEGEFEVLDWYNDEEGREKYIQKGLPHPTAFPCVVDTELNFITGSVLTMEGAKEWLEALNCPKEKQYRLRRQQLYREFGLDESAWVRALIQREVDNDSSEFESLKEKRLQVKRLIPKWEEAPQPKEKNK